MKDASSSFSIKQWHEHDRPREKLLQKGRAALSDAELLAILIGSGTREESAVNVSKKILSKADNRLQTLGKFGITELTKIKGIGTAKALTIIAAMELGRRRQSETVIERQKISNSNDVYALMWPLIGELEHEEFWIIYLNNSNKVLQTLQLSKGGITGTLVDVRLVFKKALAMGAVAIILAHNHPSGTLRPSKSDIQLTNKLKQAGKSLDIKVLDHLIVTEKAYFSLADESMI